MNYKGVIQVRVVENIPPDYGVPIDLAQAIRSNIWDLYKQGILCPGTSSRRYSGISGNGLIFDFDLDICFITSYGVEVISSTDHIKVHDPEGYLELFRSSTPVPDQEMMRYLEECIQVFRSNHLLATLVLLAAASERLLQVIAEGLSDALNRTGTITDWIIEYNRKRNISDKYDVLERRLSQSFSSVIDARDLRTIRLAFEAIRDTRNDIVHSHNYVPTWNEVSGLLHNFVLYFKLIHRTRDALSRV